MLERKVSILRRLSRHAQVIVGSIAMTVGFFLLLPLIQKITNQPVADLVLVPVDAAVVPPPPSPPPEDEQEPEPEPEEPELEMEQPTETLDLSQLELALNPGMAGGWSTGDFSIDLKKSGLATAEGGQEMFSLAELDQTPRVIYQPSPSIPGALQRRAPATVHVMFMVDTSGRVESARVQKSTDPAFESAALDAIRKWKFEPGQRGGEVVRFRMRVPITFPGR